VGGITLVFGPGCSTTKIRSVFDSYPELLNKDIPLKRKRQLNKALGQIHCSIVRSLETHLFGNFMPGTSNLADNQRKSPLPSSRSCMKK
jgi:hypothetical protein